MEASLREKYPNIKSYMDLTPIHALVIFDAVRSKQECMRKLNRWALCRDRGLKFRGRHHLTVSHAPSPSTVLWENVEMGKMESFLRSALVVLIVSLLLTLSFALILLIRVSANGLPDISSCATVQDISASEFNNVSTDQ